MIGQQTALPLTAPFQTLESKVTNFKVCLRWNYERNRHDTSDLGRRNRVPRLQRFCTKCASRTTGDEYHVVFECPAVQCVRDKYAHLFSPLVQAMQQFFWQEGMQSVVHFIRESLCIMLPATVAASVVDDSSNQPWFAETETTFLPS